MGGTHLVLLALGLLGSLEISSETPGALCPPQDAARRVIVERVGEIASTVLVRYGVRRQSVGQGMSLHIAITTGKACGPKLDQVYPLESGNCEDAAELLATVVEGFVSDPPKSTECSDRTVSLHGGAELNTIPSYGGSLGVGWRHRSGLSLGAWGSLLWAPELTVPIPTDTVDTPTDLTLWYVTGRLALMAGYTLRLNSLLDTGLLVGVGPGFELGPRFEFRTETSEEVKADGWSRFVFFAEAQNRWQYRLGPHWALDLALKGSWFFYRDQLRIVEKTGEGDQATYVTRPIEIGPNLHGSASLGVAYWF